MTPLADFMQIVAGTCAESVARCMVHRLRADGWPLHFAIMSAAEAAKCRLHEETIRALAGERLGVCDDAPAVRARNDAFHDRLIELVNRIRDASKTEVEQWGLQEPFP